MDAFAFVTHSQLGEFVKRIPKGEYIFQQGQVAKSMFFLIEGKIQLIGEKDSNEYVVSLIEPGQFLGEKSILQDEFYQRIFSAKAASDIVVLELKKSDIDKIEKENPSLISHLLRGMLQVVAFRFDRINYLVKLLRSSNNVERLVQLIVYLGRTSGKKLRGGREVHLNAESIHTFIDMDKSRIQLALDDLVRQRLLIDEGDGRYLIPNEQPLLEYVPNLIRRLAA